MTFESKVLFNRLFNWRSKPGGNLKWGLAEFDPPNEKRLCAFVSVLFNSRCLALFCGYDFAHFVVGFLPARWGLKNYLGAVFPKRCPGLFSVSLAGFQFV
jgi:hypothetical protein